MNLTRAGKRTRLRTDRVAGQDATTVFYGLHRSEILQKPQYARLKIGQIEGQTQQIKAQLAGDLSRVCPYTAWVTVTVIGADGQVPYGEPTWLTPEFKSPYFKESHRALQKAMRKFTDEVLYPDAQLCEENGKRASKTVLDAMA